MELIIGSKRWSSWSLRPWLALKKAGVDFRVTEIALRQEDTTPELARISPTRKLPILKIESGNVIWDSLAISEYAAEISKTPLWPKPILDRAQARSMVAEVHSGFEALRLACPMDLLVETSGLDLLPEVKSDLTRLGLIWKKCRKIHETLGPYLFGHWTIADAFYTPVAARIRSYDLDIAAYGGQIASNYCQALLQDHDFREWESDAKAQG